MQHLVRSDVIQNQADSLCGVQPGWHRNQLTLRQADELRVGAADRHRGNDLTWFDSGYILAEPVHYPNQVPPRREGHPGRFGMNALACHDVGQGDASSQHSHPHFALLRLWALLFKHLKCIGPAVVGNDDSRVSHEALAPYVEFIPSLGRQSPMGPPSAKQHFNQIFRIGSCEPRHKKSVTALALAHSYQRHSTATYSCRAMPLEHPCFSA